MDSCKGSPSKSSLRSSSAAEVRSVTSQSRPTAKFQSSFGSTRNIKLPNTSAVKFTSKPTPRLSSTISVKDTLTVLTDGTDSIRHCLKEFRLKHRSEFGVDKSTRQSDENLELLLSSSLQFKLSSNEEHLDYAQSLFDGILESKFLTLTGDVQVLVEGVAFKMHRILLEHHSPKLAKIATTNSFAVPLHFVPSDVFAIIHQWMYGQPVNLGNVGFEQLFSYAVEMGFENLAQQCAALKNKFLKPRYAPKMMDFAVSRRYQKLDSHALHQMAVNFSDIIREDEFLDLSSESVHRLLSCDDLYARDEMEILRAALRWLTHREEAATFEQSVNQGDKGDLRREKSVNRLEHGEQILNCVRLETMTPKDFLSIRAGFAEDLRLMEEEWTVRETKARHHFLSIPATSPNGIQGGQNLRRNLGKTAVCRNDPKNILLLEDMIAMDADIGESVTDEEDDASSVRLEILLGQRPVNLDSNNGPSHDAVPINEMDAWLSHVVQNEINETVHRAERCLNFIRFLKDPKTADLVLSCDGKLFPVHRLLVAYHIPDSCESLFSPRNSSKDLMMVHGVRVKSLALFVRWMYADEGFKIGGPNALSFSKAMTIGKRLRCQHLLDRLQRLTTESLEDPAFALHVISTADVIGSPPPYEKLERLLYDQLTRRFLDIVRGRFFEHLTVDQVKWMLCNDDIYIESELDVLKAATRWLNASYNTRAKFASDVLGYVRWPLMTATELLDLSFKDDSSNLLTSIYPQWRNQLAKTEHFKIAELYGDELHQDFPVRPRNNLGNMDCDASEAILKCNLTYEDFKPRTTDRCRITVRKLSDDVECQSSPTRLPESVMSLEGTESMVSLNDSELSIPAQRSKRKIQELENEPEVVTPLQNVSSIFSSSNETIVLFGQPPKHHSAASSKDSKDGGCSLYFLNQKTIEWNWNATAKMPHRRRQAVAVLLNTDIYVSGGVLSSLDEPIYVTASVVRYDLSGGDFWIPTRPMLHARTHHGSAVCKGLLYVVGGNDGRKLMDDVEAFDPKTNRWTSLCPMSGSRSHISVATHSDKVWVCGGLCLDVSGNEYVSDWVQRYDPLAVSWTNISRLSFPRMASVLVSSSADDKLFLIGGQRTKSKGICRDVNDVDVFENRKWQRETSLMDSGRHRINLGATISAGSILIVASSSVDSSTSVRLYDLKRKCWLSSGIVPDLPIAIQDFGCLVVPSLQDTSFGSVQSM